MKETFIKISIDKQDNVNSHVKGSGHDLLLLLCNAYHFHNDLYDLIKESIRLYDNKEKTLSTIKS